MGKKKTKVTANQILVLLQQKHKGDVFVPECKDGPTQGTTHSRLDAWAAKKSWSKPCTYAYEIKISRADFLQDEKWHQYLQFCNEFYFVAPAGVIKPEEIPQQAGYLQVASAGTKLLKKKRAPWRDVAIPEDFYRYILFCRTRVCNRWDVDKPTTREELQEWMESKEKDRKFGHLVSGKMREQYEKDVMDVRDEMRRVQLQNDRLEGVRQILDDLGIDREWVYTHTVERAIKERRGMIPPHFERSLRKGISDLENLLAVIQEFKTGKEEEA